MYILKFHIFKIPFFVSEYFGNGWNIFDLTIVVASLLDLGLESVDGISVLRGMRLVSYFIIRHSMHPQGYDAG
jgi:hypothetical protein